MISVLIANIFLRKGCEAFLACAINSKGGDSNLANIPMVYRFSYVFPEELLGLPSAKKMEFSIYLVSNTIPIFRAPYRMASIELKELKA